MIITCGVVKTWLGEATFHKEHLALVLPLPRVRLSAGAVPGRQQVRVSIVQSPTREARTAAWLQALAGPALGAAGIAGENQHLRGFFFQMKNMQKCKKGMYSIYIDIYKTKYMSFRHS